MAETRASMKIDQDIANIDMQAYHRALEASTLQAVISGTTQSIQGISSMIGGASDLGAFKPKTITNPNLENLKWQRVVTKSLKYKAQRRLYNKNTIYDQLSYLTGPFM